MNHLAQYWAGQADGPELAQFQLWEAAIPQLAPTWQKERNGMIEAMATRRLLGQTPELKKHQLWATDFQPEQG